MRKLLAVILWALGPRLFAGPLPVPPETRAARGEAWLSRAANADGGFGYTAGGMSFTAPTALAVLALEPGRARDQAVHWLERSELPSGAWPVTAGDPDPSWMTAPAVAALARVPAREARVASGRAWLLKSSLAFRGPDKPAAGWPWTPGTAPWIEPTAWALLALGGPTAGGPARRRIDDAVRYVVSEMNRTGGWSLYEARPYPYHTALVLLAVQGLPSSVTGSTALAAGAARGRAFLEDSIRSTDSAQDLAWALWTLSTGLPELASLSAGFNRLGKLQSPDGSWDESPWRTAAAVNAYRALLGHDPLAWTGSSHGR